MSVSAGKTVQEAKLLTTYESHLFFQHFDKLIYFWKSSTLMLNLALNLEHFLSKPNGVL